jgi:CheY-like chemotaxis protein
MSLKAHLVAEAAHGVIAELLAVDIDTAERVLDGYVRRSGRSLREVATEVADRSLRLTWFGRDEPGTGGNAPAATLDVLYIGDRQRNGRFLEQIPGRWPDVQLRAIPPMTQGIEAIRQHPPDLMLLDGSLPDLDGRRVLRQIRSDPSTARLPIVVISAEEGRQRATTFLAEGANQFLTEPLDSIFLNRLIVDLTNAARAATGQRPGP